MTKSKYMTMHDFGVFTEEHCRLTKREPKVKVEWNKDDIKKAIIASLDEDMTLHQIYREVIYPMKNPCLLGMVDVCLSELVMDGEVKRYQFIDKKGMVYETVYYI